VLVAGAPADKAARLVDSGEPIALEGDAPRFVSRGGEKLDAALDTFGVDVDGRRALDAGASTGGFTDCLLQRGARHVIAVDVGHGQLHPRIREDRRVTVLERRNIRALVPDDVGGPVDLVTADLSFISLRTVAAALVGLLRPGGDLVVLIKPQFEAGRRIVSRGGGVVRDPAVWTQAIEDVVSAFAELDAAMIDLVESPITGASGNVEFLARFRARGTVGSGSADERPSAPVDVAAVVARAAGGAG
jgi:23S rRNA (cytidine1920-2'-O)/16S rRNA (cytidine1409-2'-O)-methyltransferase